MQQETNSLYSRDQIHKQRKNHELSDSIKKKKEIWKSAYKDKDPNNKFNSFLCTFFNIFQPSFPIKYKN